MDKMLRKMPCVGASAGSVTASLLLANADLALLPDVAITIAEKWDLYNPKRESGSGLQGIWGSMLLEFLELALPDTLNPSTDLANLQIALTPLRKIRTGIHNNNNNNNNNNNKDFTYIEVPLPGSPKLVSNFEDKSDLISAIMASCHIPMFLDGLPTASYKSENVVDGSLW
jgi:predicted acylesterase/phospholipase RssA